MDDLKYIDTWWKHIGCMRNPGAHSGEEAARDMEIAELRAYATRLEQLVTKYETIIGHAYQVVGAYWQPGESEVVLDVLADPERATQEQVDAMLPFAPAASEPEGKQ